ncbi:hypothetical protein SCOR_26745 [Sulfidibacter corallicola]|uniref:Uncharacterized protein n=1 Tax=Sulfidibacter corallicola TaxID=2818388 RepID=A0A8A4TN24_SULCO|nr:hypothetical protein [Sulfidibacter corallicola]QTD50847.1 hypothetical protein J3U87_00130 [Sulfidibacter corallicola]
MKHLRTSSHERLVRGPQGTTSHRPHASSISTRFFPQSPHKNFFLFSIFLVSVFILSGAPLWAQIEQHPELIGKRVLTNQKGKPVPFENDEAIRDFLSNAEVVAEDVIGSGITKPFRLTLEKDGIRLRSIFRHIQRKEDRIEIEGKIHRYFEDSYKFELAAYKLAEHLGLPHVPPVIPYTYKGIEGSLQIWIELAITDRTRVMDEIPFPSFFNAEHQLQTMKAFDVLIYNFDRNELNYLYDIRWYVWYIDHSRSFKPDSVLPQLDDLTKMRRDVYQKLKNWDKKAINKKLKPHLNRMQLIALHRRQKKILEHVDDLIAQHGEAQVLFDK